MSSGILTPDGRPAPPADAARAARVVKLHAELGALVGARNAVAQCLKVQGEAAAKLLDAYAAEIKRRAEELEFLGEKQPGGGG